MSVLDQLKGLGGHRNELVDRFEAALTVAPGRRAGDPETVVSFDHLLPDPGRVEGDLGARWRLATARHRLVGFPVSGEALAEWHRADPHKGRRLVAADLHNRNRAAAILSWHYEPRRGRRGRPHLITSLAVRGNVSRELRAEYVVALWLLTCVALAIDRKTVRRKRIGVVLDNAIELSLQDLTAIGFSRGPQRGGYRGEYYELRA